MQSIAICEDERTCQEHLLEILHSIKTEGELHIDSFGSGEELLENFSYGKYDLIFMDIYMKQLSGVETVTRIRAIDKDVTIAFTTTSQDHALEAYRLDVIKYLEKPLDRNDVLECIRTAQLKISSKRKVTLLIAGRERSFHEDQIIFFEQQNHTVLLHLQDQPVLSFSGKIDELSENLSMPALYRCHKSYLVNMAQVEYIDRELNLFVMKDGSHAYIKRDQMKEAGRILDQFLFEQLRKDMK